MCGRIGPYRIRRIFDGVYRIRSCGVNMFLFCGRNESLLFDTGYGFSPVAPVIRSLTDLPYSVVCSHGHYDHIGGSTEFRQVYLHSADLPTAHRHASAEYRRQAILTGRKNANPVFGDSFSKDFDAKKYIHAPEAEYLPVGEGDMFDLGGMHLQVIELPGHTPGSIGLRWQEENVLFTSDAVNGHLYLFLPESMPLSVYRETLYKVRAMNVRFMIQGHPTGKYTKRDLKHYIEAAEDPDWAHGRIRPHLLRSGNEEEVRCVLSTKHPRLSAKIFITGNRLGKGENQ